MYLESYISIYSIYVLIGEDLLEFFLINAVLILLYSLIILYEKYM